MYDSKHAAVVGGADADTAAAAHYRSGHNPFRPADQSANRPLSYRELERLSREATSGSTGIASFLSDSANARASDQSIARKCAYYILGAVAVAVSVSGLWLLNGGARASSAPSGRSTPNADGTSTEEPSEQQRFITLGINFMYLGMSLGAAYALLLLYRPLRATNATLIEAQDRAAIETALRAQAAAQRDRERERERNARRNGGGDANDGAGIALVAPRAVAVVDR